MRDFNLPPEPEMPPEAKGGIGYRIEMGPNAHTPEEPPTNPERTPVKSKKVLFVDDEETMRRLLTREAERAEIEDFEVFEDADSVVTRLESLDESPAAIFSDGLFGGWRDVVAAAQTAGVPAFVVSGDTDLQQTVEEAGAVFMSKTTLEPGFVGAALAELQ